MDSGKCVRILGWVLDSGTFFGFWEVFWVLGRVFGFWEVFWILGSVSDSGTCFWILVSVLDSGTCFVPTSHRRFLIILLILPIFDRHKIGKFQTQKSLLGIRL